MAKSNSIISGTKHKLNISASVNALRVDTDESTNVFNVQGSQTSVVNLSASQNISASAFFGDGSNLTGITIDQISGAAPADNYLTTFVQPPSSNDPIVGVGNTITVYRSDLHARAIYYYNIANR